MVDPASCDPIYRYSPKCHIGRPQSLRWRSSGCELLRTWSSLSRLTPAAFMTEPISETTKPITKSSQVLLVTVI